MPTFRERFSQATRALFGRGQDVKTISEAPYSYYGIPPLFDAQCSLKAYGDNVWLYRAIHMHAVELANTKLKLRDKTSKDVKYIENHQALATLAKPQPTKTGKSMITAMDLMILTGMHMGLNGEAFWLLQNRLIVNGAPTFIRPLLPQSMRVNVEGSDVIEYTYDLRSEQFKLDPLDVVHFKWIDP